MEALANLAHELRTPVQVMLGYLDILRGEMSAGLDNRQIRIIERLNANAYDLAQTVENMSITRLPTRWLKRRAKRKYSCTN